MPHTRIGLEGFLLVSTLDNVNGFIVVVWPAQAFSVGRGERRRNESAGNCQRIEHGDQRREVRQGDDQREKAQAENREH